MKTSTFIATIETNANAKNRAWDVARRLRMLADEVEQNGAIGVYRFDEDGSHQIQRGNSVTGTITKEVGTVSVTTFSPEGRSLLDEIMTAYCDPKLPATHDGTPGDVYRFAYWLIRHSGLVMPAKPAAG